MKIDYAIMSCNDSAMYKDFWPIVYKCWQKINIQPILLYFGNDKLEYSEHVFKFDYVENINTTSQVQLARFFGVNCKGTDKTYIITDIDMLPLSNYFFNEKIEDFNDDFYLHLNPCIKTYGRIPMCYHVARGTTYKEILNIPDNFQEYIKNVNSVVDINTNSWNVDEMFSTIKIMQHRTINKNNIVFLNREFGQNGRRIDRLTNDVWRTKYRHDMIQQQLYFDCHCIRPYIKYKNIIDEIVNSFLKS